MKYETDPPRASRGPVLPRPLFSLDPVRNRGIPGVGPLKHVSDDLLIATLVAHGQPRWAAEEVRRYPPVRLAALRFWVDVHDAAKGDPHARERVDRCRELWQIMRRIELISDRPDHTIGIFER